MTKQDLNMFRQPMKALKKKATSTVRTVMMSK